VVSGQLQKKLLLHGPLTPTGAPNTPYPYGYPEAGRMRRNGERRSASGFFDTSVRATVDADFIADIQPAQIHDLILVLKDEFYMDPDMILDSIIHQSTFNLIHMDTMFKIDVFILKDRPFEINEMHRRILQIIGDEPSHKAYFVTAEGSILAKLDWFKAGGELSERQWKDVQGILRLQKDRLGLVYLKKWSAEMGLADLFSRALAEAGLAA